MADKANTLRKSDILKKLSGLLFGGLLLLPFAASPAKAQTAHGLLGQYYSWNSTLACPTEAADEMSQIFTTANLTGSRIDATVNFGNPYLLPGTTPHNFAAQWTGYIVVPTSGDYSFTSTSDDGIRIWIATSPTQKIDPATDAPDITEWLGRGEGADDPAVTVTMQAGQKYPVVIRYFECTGGNATRFRYTAPGATASSIVPTDILVPPTATDTTAPAAISDLKATSITAHNATLTFTAPGDNGTTGQATGYDIRYATYPINDTNFSVASQMNLGLHPKTAGSAESIATTFSPLQGYYVAIKTMDAFGNSSALSNVAQFSTPAVTYPTLPQVVDKAVYFDGASPVGWVNLANAQQIDDYFIGKGYKEVDAKGLADFMKSHIASKTSSVIVSAMDVMPDTVIDLSSGAVTKTNIINDYMNGGGRIIHYGDIPFYNVYASDGTEFNAADAGSRAILGFYSAGGTWDQNDTSVISPEGQAFGLKSTWVSVRPALVNDVDITLETSKGGAAGWMKFFPDSSGPGFFARIVDDTPTGNLCTADELADGQRLAEFSGAIVAPQGRLNGVVTDGQGNPVANAVLTFAGATGLTGGATTDSQGSYSLLLAPDTYSLTGSMIGSQGVKQTIAGNSPIAIKAATFTQGPSVTIANIALPTLPKVADKAVYYDTAYGASWTDAATVDAIDAYFTSAGYKEVDAAGLATFMKSHATSKTPSVVIMAEDVFPDTVVDVTSGAVTAKNIVNDYMNNGGRIVYAGDIPFYNIKQADGTVVLSPGVVGSTTILGFPADGTRDLLDTTVITPVGQAIGLKATWRSQRPTAASGVDIVVDNAKGGAAGWIKFYPDNAGSGMFIRMMDAGTGTDAYTDAEYADIQLLAELSGIIPGVTAPVTVKLGDLNGDGKINVSDATISLRIAVGLVTPTADQKTADDVNKDGKTTVADTTLILQVAVGVKSGF